MANKNPQIISPLAGFPPPKELLIDTEALINAYYNGIPELSNKDALVSFGTSGHRGSSHKGTFLEGHVFAITQAVADYRKSQGLTGPLFLGIDTHALSKPAQDSALQVLLANEVRVHVQLNGGYTPTPAVSNAILTHNCKQGQKEVADGIVITPSHNPPDDAGIKYNPPHGGPAESAVTRTIQETANKYLIAGNKNVKRIEQREIAKSLFLNSFDMMGEYVDGLERVVNLEAIKKAGVRIGVHPLGGASVEYWRAIRERYELDLEIVNEAIDPTFSFMTVDHDGKVRMDCSSPYAMAGLVKLKDSFDVAIGNDPDADRHGIVTPSGGLLNPNHYLAVAVDYLFKTRKEWPRGAAVGKTVVTSSLIDKVALSLDREVFEVPVGFKWFAPGLHNGSLGFAGEESAGASFLTKDGKPWSTDKDGIILGLLAAEIKATTGIDPYQYLQEKIVSEFGMPAYKRLDFPIDPKKREQFSAFSEASVDLTSLGEPIISAVTKAKSNNESIGGLLIRTEHAWIAIRPSGTEPIVKVYGESWKGEEHLSSLLSQAQGWVYSFLK